MALDSADKTQPDADSAAGLSVEAGSRQIFDLLPPEPGDDEPDADAGRAAAPQPDPDDDDDAADADRDIGPDDDDADTPPPKSEAPKTRRFKADGKDLEVSEEEFERLASAGVNYTRKSQALAEKERAFETERASQKAIEAAYAERIRKLDDVLAQNEEAEPNWVEVQAEDPDNYLARHAAFLNRRQQREKVSAERQRVEKGARVEQEKQYTEYVRREFDQLVEHLPVFKDPAKGREVMRSVYDFAETQYGFTRAELENTSDHRALRAVHDAMQYHKGREKVRDAKDKVDSTPTLVPGAPPKPAGKEAAFDGAIQRVRRTGNVRDGARAIELLLK